MIKKILLLCLVLTGLSVSAQNVRQFGYSFNNTHAFFEGAELGPTIIKDKYTKYNALFFLNGYYNQNPVVIKTGVNRDERLSSFVTNHTGINFGATFFLSPRFQIGASADFVNATINVFNNYNPTAVGAFSSVIREDKKSAISDIYIMAKYKLGDFDKNYSFALIPSFRVPTGDPDSFTTDNSIGMGLDLAMDYKLSFAQIGASVGYHYAKDAVYIIPNSLTGVGDIVTDLDYSQKIKTALAAYIPFSEKFGANLEFIRFWTMPLGTIQNPNELYAGLRFQATRAISLFGGAAFGSFDSVDGNNYRIVGGLKIINPRAPAIVAPPETISSLAAYTTTNYIVPVIAMVTDNDNVIGLPSLRIVQMSHPNDTRCEILGNPPYIRFTPLENFVGKATCRYEVCSATKICSQSDLVVEVIKPAPEAPPVVAAEPYGDLTWNKSIYFCNDCHNIDSRSHRVLDELIEYLKIKGKKINKIVIEGHTSLRATAQYNLELSKKRCKNTYAELLKSGVNPNLLEMVAYGENRPEVPTLEGKTKHPTNRRVEFRIYEK